MMENFSEYILWTQSSKTQEKDILLVDNKTYTTLDGSSFFSYINLIPDNSSPKWMPIFENSQKKHKSRKNDISPSFSVYKNNDGCTLVKSTYQDKDESNRKIAFLFCCKSVNLKKVASELIIVSDSIKRELNRSDLSMLSALRFRHLIYIIGLFSLLSILAILWTIIL